VRVGRDNVTIEAPPGHTHSSHLHTASAACVTARTRGTAKAGAEAKRGRKGREERGGRGRRKRRTRQKGRQKASTAGTTAPRVDAAARAAG